MINRYLLLLFCLFLPVSGGEWKQVTTDSFEAGIKKVVPVSDLKTFVLTKDNTLFVTKNYGNDWQQVKSFYSSSDLVFENEQLGWVVSTEALYITKNGGESWDSVTVPFTYKHSFSFVDSLIGYAVSDSNELYKSVNSGVSWQKVDNDIRGTIKSVQFTSPAVGWALAREVILSDSTYVVDTTATTVDTIGIEYTYLDTTFLIHSSDSGKKWEIFERSCKSTFSNMESSGFRTGLYSLFAFNDSTAFTQSGTHGTEISGFSYENWSIRKTESQGAFWDNARLPNEITGLSFITDSIGWITTTNGSGPDGMSGFGVYMTSDFGTTWENQIDFEFLLNDITLYDIQLESIVMNSATHGWVWGYTWDNGSTTPFLLQYDNSVAIQKPSVVQKEFYMQLNNSTLTIKGDGIASISLYSLSGKKLLNRSIESHKIVQLDLGVFSKGMYLVEVKHNQGRFVQNIINR